MGPHPRVKNLVIAAAAFAFPLLVSADIGAPLAPVRLHVVSAAATTDVTVAGATVAAYISTVLAGPSGVRSSQTGQTLRLSRNTPGETAEAQFDIVLADVSPDQVTWNVAADSAAKTQFEVYSLVDLSRPRLVDRFDSSAPAAQFATESRLIGRGRLHLDRVTPRLVLAEFFPWYSRNTWDGPEFSDRPLRPYSSDDPADLAAIATEARAAGIDAFVVAWQAEKDDGRLQLALDAFHQAGFRGCAYTGTDVDGMFGAADAPTMLTRLTHLTDQFGNHPAHLKYGAHPVIFVYGASGLPQSDWLDVFARLRASGRNPVVIGDFFHSTLLEAFDGEHQYSNVGLSIADLFNLDRTETLRVRSYHLLRENDRRRIWVASVTPGYDDRLLGRATPLLVDRGNGQRYDDEWGAAVDTEPDWIIISSWNEWSENSEIEPGVKYGSFYLDRTRFWTGVFKGK